MSAVPIIDFTPASPSNAASTPGSVRDALLITPPTTPLPKFVGLVSTQPFLCTLGAQRLNAQVLIPRFSTADPCIPSMYPPVRLRQWVVAPTSTPISLLAHSKPCSVPAS